MVVARFTFHLEATDKVSELIEQVKAKGMGVGVALKPATPVEVRLLPGPCPSVPLHVRWWRYRTSTRVEGNRPLAQGGSLNFCADFTRLQNWAL